MDKETLDELIDECTKVLRDTSSVLSQNLRQIKDESRDLREKQKKLEEWDSDHLQRNKHLLIDFDNIVPSNLVDQLQDAIRKLHGLKDKFVQYSYLIENNFEALATKKRDEIEDLLGSNRE